jgi:hypothetical protein
MRAVFAIACDLKHTIMAPVIRIIDRLLAWWLLPAMGRTRRVLIHVELMCF